MLACFRLGAVVLPCTEQLRAADLRTRLAVARPRLVVCDERNLGVLGEAAPDAEVLVVPGPELTAAEPAAAVELDPEDPCLVTFTSGTSGEPKAVLHGQRYLAGQHVQAEHWLAPAADRLSWCTAASGWSKSARNVFIAPWLRGAAALLHDARFDPHERLEILAREEVDTLCMAPTEYRVIAKRAALRRVPRAARARRRRRGAQPRGAARLARGDRPVDPRRLRPDRDRPAHRHAARRGGAPRLDGPRAAGRRARRRTTASSCADPATVPTFFVRYLGGEARARRAVADRRPRPPRRRRLPVLRGPARRRDHLRRLPDRPVRGRVRARRPRGGGRGRRRGGARRGARQRRARGRRAARRARAVAPRWRPSCRSTSRRRPRRTSTRASSTSPTSCPRRRAGRCGGRCSGTERQRRLGRAGVRGECGEKLTTVVNFSPHPPHALP